MASENARVQLESEWKSHWLVRSIRGSWAVHKGSLEYGCRMEQVGGSRLWALFGHGCHKMAVFCGDLLPGIIGCVIPNGLRWGWRRLSGSIVTHPLPSGKSVFFHGSRLDVKSSVRVAILLHGDHSHPSTLLHLGDLLEQSGWHVFSIHHTNTCSSSYSKHLLEATREIKQLIEEREGSLGKILLVGHSRGAMVAERSLQNLLQDTAVFSIAGNHEGESWKGKAGYIREVVATGDRWCLHPTRTLLGKGDRAPVGVPAGHLSVLSHKAIRATLLKFSKQLLITK